jgi:UDP-N-acetylglucosamine diphosphorylase / glucose-1-phosphate thymidylyltransferase / UDP-N-acetylgalactosamine diphosphorylase / glucosamine-1-phosphate N-acetyltransferase / galactosamine-1-phosphate N-acetyltransferase
VGSNLTPATLKSIWFKSRSHLIGDEGPAKRSVVGSPLLQKMTKVIILAGGMGKRMQPIQKDKLLIPFQSKPLIQHVLERLINSNAFDEYVIVAGAHNQDAIEQIASQLKIKYMLAIQPESNGMAGSILAAKEYLEGPIVIVNGDDLLPEDAYRNHVISAQRSKTEVSLLLKIVNQYFPGGYIRFERDKIIGIEEKPCAGNEPSDKIKLVVDYFKDGKSLIKLLESTKSDHDDVYEKALTQIIDQTQVSYTVFDGPWSALKQPWHVLAITQELLMKVERNISPDATISPHAIIEGPVVIESGVRIFEYAVVKGPAYIGENTIIGNNALIRESIIESDCLIGSNTEITRSYIGPNCSFHINYVGDSVLEEDISFGARSLTANFRLDHADIRLGKEKIETNRQKLGLICGRGVRLGSSVTTMPGIRIGAGSLVGPGIVISRDIHPDMKMILQQEYLVETIDKSK